MLHDASVLRNFAILGWASHLVALSGGVIRVAHGILGLDADEVGELDRIRDAFERELRASVSSPAGSRLASAVVGLEALTALRGSDLEVVLPTSTELSIAARLQDPEERTWLRSLGVRARRLDAGEAVSVAIATSRGEPFASDDEAARAAYLGLGGAEHLWTLDLVKRAVVDALLPEDEARVGYQALVEHFGFWGPRWL
jgi:predicted nucleic acid-binding protein